MSKLLLVHRCRESSVIAPPPRPEGYQKPSRRLLFPQRRQLETCPWPALKQRLARRTSTAATRWAGGALTRRPRNRSLCAQPLPFGGVGNLDDPRGGSNLSVPIGECSRQVELPDSRDPVLGEQRQCNNLRRRAVGGHVPESIQNGSKLHYQEQGDAIRASRCARGVSRNGRSERPERR